MRLSSDRLRAALQVYWVTDGLGGYDPLVWLERATAAMAGGVTCLQLRDKHASDRELVERARAVQSICRRFGVPLVINDRIDVAVMVSADGIHLGQSDISPRLARGRLPDYCFIGWSVENVSQVETAHSLPVDYLAVSPLFDTPTKVDTAPAFGLHGLSEVRAITPLPLVAIGGVNLDNVASVLQAGADGVAMVRAIEEASDPRSVAQTVRGHFGLIGRTPSPVKVLTIAGSDSGGGAGIQADLKTISALGCFGTSAVTAVTAQNTRGVQEIHALPPEFLAQQIESVLIDIGADAIKIGMLHDQAIVDVVAEMLDRYSHIPVVLDPVMVATSGDALIQKDTISSIVHKLLPRATVVTPNFDELCLLVGARLSGLQEAIAAAGRLIATAGARALLVKGGHIPGDAVIDVLVDKSGERLRLTASRISSQNTHGTGCSLSSAIAAHIALGFSLEDSVQRAVDFVQEGLHSAQHLRFGAGHGPLDHQHNPQRLVRKVPALLL